MLNLPSIFNLSFEELALLLNDLSEPEYRSEQLYYWLYKVKADKFSDMTNLPQSLQRKLEERFVVYNAHAVKQRISKEGNTLKLLLKLFDGKTVESVLLRHGGEKKRWYTVCVSAQVGCKMNCSFCATGRQGFERNLNAGEIVQQVMYFLRSAENQMPIEASISSLNIVYMGMGEPLDNFEQTIKSIGILNNHYGLKIGARHITVSTAGLIPAIRKLIEYKLQVGLAISLHAPNNRLRNSLVPLNMKYPLEDLKAVCKGYIAATSRRITFEYVLLDGINDSDVCAGDLVKLLKGMNCHVNLIPSNMSTGTFKRPPLIRIERFKSILIDGGINCTIRKGMGEDIEAGCGQLKSRYLQVVQPIL